MYRQISRRQLFTLYQRFDDPVHHKKRYHIGNKCDKYRHQRRIGVPDVMPHIGLYLIKHHYFPFFSNAFNSSIGMP